MRKLALLAGLFATLFLVPSLVQTQATQPAHKVVADGGSPIPLCNPFTEKNCTLYELPTT